MTRTSRLCDALMEACWLSAAAVAPLFFNIFSRRAFEPDKTALIRSLALVMLAAWVVKQLAGPRLAPAGFSAVWKRLRAFPFTLPVLAVLFTTALSTLFSVAPAVSLSGSYHRLQGLYTTLAYLGIFAVLAGNLRRPTQVQRLVSVVVLSSLPVSLYALLQRFQADPVLWGLGLKTFQRVTSSLGNPIFLAAYLIMVIPLTLGRLGAARARRSWILAVFYLVMAALQVLAAYYTASRGPLLGLAAGLGLFFLLRAFQSRRRAWVGGVLLAALLAGAFLALLNLPSGPFQALRSAGNLERLSQMLDTSSPTARIRSAYWNIAARMLEPHEALTYPDGRKDVWNPLRLLIGYGPEAMFYASHTFYDPEITLIQRQFTQEQSYAPPDRSHNETWDTLVFSGLLGLAAQLWLVLAAFSSGLRWLGLIHTPPEKRLFLLFAGGGAAGGALTLAIWQGLGFAGVGLPFGLVMGVAAFCAVQALRAPERPRPASGRAWLLSAVLALLCAHYIEINFAIAISVTRLLFWMFLAVLALAGEILPDGQEDLPATPIQPAAARAGRRAHSQPAPQVGAFHLSPAVWSAAAFSALLLAALGFAFLRQGYAGPGETILQSLTRLPGSAARPSALSLLMVAGVWLAVPLAFLAEEQPGAPRRDFWKGAAASLGLSALLGLAFFVWHAWQLSSLGGTLSGSQEELLGRIRSFENLFLNFCLFLVALIGLWAWSLRAPGGTGLAAFSPGRLAAAGVASAVALALALLTNLNAVRADIAFNLADPLGQQNRWDLAIPVYERVLALAPGENYYYPFLSRAYLRQALQSQNAAREALFRKAGESLLEGRRINPLNTDHTTQLAFTYTQWGSASDNSEVKAQRFQQADETYRLAASLSPHNAEIYYQWGFLHLGFLQNEARGLELLNRSMQEDPLYDLPYALLGDTWSRQARSLPTGEEQEKLYRQAEENYRQAIQRNPKKTIYSLALAEVYVDQADYPAALQAYQAAEEQLPKNRKYEIEKYYVRLYRLMGDRAAALEHALKGLQSAPDEARAAYQQILDEINAGE